MSRKLALLPRRVQTPIGVLPADWEVKQLGENAYIKARIGWRGLSADEYTKDGPLLVAGTHIRGAHIDWMSCDHVSDFRYEESPEIQLQEGDVILSKDGTLGRVGIVERLPGRATINGTMMLVRPKRDTFESKFLYNYLQGRNFRRFIKEKVSGSSVPHIFQRDMVRLLAPSPPLPEQRKIAAILSSVDNAIEKAQAVIDQMQVVKRGLMQELLTRSLPVRHRAGVGELSDGWSLKHIGELGEVVTGSTPSTKRHAYWNGTVPFVTPSDLGKIKRINGTGRYVTEEGLAQVREIPPGAVMVTCIGATIGKLGIAEKKCCTNQQINSIIPNISIVLTEYLYYAMSFASNALAGIAGTTAVPIVSKNHFVRFGLTIPPLAEQEEIAKVLAGVDQFVDANEAYQTKLTEMKVGLMSVLLTGELRVTPDPEPA